MGFDLLYLLAFLLGLPFWIWKLATEARWRHRLADRFARYEGLGEPPAAGRLWIVAASVGEVRAIGPLIAALRRERPGIECVLSTQTATGWAEARRLHANIPAFKIPLDLSWIAVAALENLRPTAVILVEGELWPNLVREAAR